MKLTDGKKTVEVQIIGKNGIDWAEEFYEVGSLKYDEQADAYTVEDVDYCIEQAKDWEQGQGDFWECGAGSGEYAFFEIVSKKYRVFKCGGEHDGEVITEVDDLADAINAAHKAESDLDSDDDTIGIAIWNLYDDEEVFDW